MYLAIDPADEGRILVPVVGLPFAGYDLVRDKIELGTDLILKPVDNNPHDANAIEVHFQEGEKSVRIGFAPRDAAPGLRLALGLEAIQNVVPAGQVGDFLAVSISNDVAGFMRLAQPADEPNTALHKNTGDKDEPWPFRGFLPGDPGPDACPQDDDELLLLLVDRLRAKSPDHPTLKQVREAMAQSLECPADDYLFEVSDALRDQLIGIPDPACDPACAQDKIGGLPYCEAGWSWPHCPSCEEEMVFVGQSRDPANPDDLIQAFWCPNNIDYECDEGASLSEDNSMVRLWRNPAPISPETIRPNDNANLIPGHRLTERDQNTEETEPRMRRDGITCTHFNQATYEQGRHRVFSIYLGNDLLNGNTPETYTVVRHGRGLVTAWEDWGG